MSLVTTEQRHSLRKAIVGGETLCVCPSASCRWRMRDGRVLFWDLHVDAPPAPSRVYPDLFALIKGVEAGRLSLLN